MIPFTLHFIPFSNWKGNMGLKYVFILDLGKKIYIKLITFEL